MSEIRAGLVGISGYAGMELARLLAAHPAIHLTMACSRAESGRKLGDFYPFLAKLPGADVEISVYDPDQAARLCDLVFLAVPAGTAMQMAADLVPRGVKIVDFSADFRLRDPAVYEAWYKIRHTASDLLPTAVYGLPELHEERIREASLVANPGCYPTATILALYPALKSGLVKPNGIVVDAKSGASGAGRKAAIPLLFCEVSDDFRPYGLPTHRHTPEIEQELGDAGAPVTLLFTPHLVPMKRGILATIYTELADADISEADVRAVYEKEWGDKPWIRLLKAGQLPETVYTRGSMFCDIAWVLDPRTGRLILLSAIDNLCRGAAGQALACANLMLGLPVDCGMEHLAPLA